MSHKEIFTLGEVLTVTTGRLLCPIDGAYRILNHLTGESLFTHQIPRAMAACRPYVLEMYPALATVDADADGVNHENYLDWLGRQQEKFGDLFPLYPAHKEVYTPKDPLEELRGMVPDERIIVVTREKDDSPMTLPRAADLTSPRSRKTVTILPDRCFCCSHRFGSVDESGFVVYRAYGPTAICTVCADYERPEAKASRRYDRWMVRYKSSSR